MRSGLPKKVSMVSAMTDKILAGLAKPQCTQRRDGPAFKNTKHASY